MSDEMELHRQASENGWMTGILATPDVSAFTRGERVLIVRFNAVEAVVCAYLLAMNGQGCLRQHPHGGPEESGRDAVARWLREAVQ